MKTATAFYSDFFQTDCVVVDGDPHFTITGATKTLYGSIGGAAMKQLRAYLVKTSTPQTPVTASDLSDLDGIVPVLGFNGHMEQEALAMSQGLFKQLLFQYWLKDTKAGKYARKIIHGLVDVSMDLILRKEAGLLHEEASKAIDESILRTLPDGSKAYSGRLGDLQDVCYSSYYGKKEEVGTPYPQPEAFGRWFARVLNEGVYSRVAPNLRLEVRELREKHGGSIWQHLSDDVRTALTPVILLMIQGVRRDKWFNMDQIIKSIDEFYPRYDQGYKRPKFKV